MGSTSVLVRFLIATIIAIVPTLTVLNPANAAASGTMPTSMVADITNFKLLSSTGTTPSISNFSGSVRVVVTTTNGTSKITTTTGLTAPTGYSSSDWTAGAASLGFEGSLTNVNNAIATISYKGTTAGSAASVQLSAISAGAAYNPDNGHYYEIVNNGSAINWATARANAKARTFNGLTGYLATITSQAEQTFLYSKTVTTGWIGASDGYDVSTNQIWKWADGPEAGQTFWTTACGTGAQGICSSTGMYNFWNSGEPNGVNGSEDNGEFGFGSGGQWNDCQNGCNRTQYIVEYGGAGGTAAESFEATTTISVETAPGAPTISSLTNTGSALSIAFTAGSANGSAITAFQYSTNSGSNWTNLSGLTSPQVISADSTGTSLSSGTSYTVILRAVNAIGNSASSSSATKKFIPDSVFSTSNFVTGGTSGNSASYDATTGAYVLTENEVNRYGTVWSTSRIDVTEDFVINASVNLGSSDAGADGLAFVIQPASTNSGTSGGGLGYLGITNSFAVEFDTYFNNGSDSTSLDHITYIANGAAATSAAHTAYVTPYTGDLEDNTWRDVRFTWNATTKVLKTEFETVDGSSITQILSATVNLPSAGLLNSNYAYWGFTAATGGATNKQQVKILSYTAAARANTAPTVTAISNQTILSALSANDVAVAFSDDSSTSAQFRVSASSSNQSVIADADIVESVSSSTAGNLAITPKGIAGTTNITVTVSDADGSSTARTFAVTVFAPPSVPRNVTSSILGTTATISWLAPSSNGGSAISKYIASAQHGSDTPFTCNVTSGSMDSCQISGLTEGVQYTVTVVAENTAIGALAKQTSANSSAVKFAVPTKISTPGTIPAQITKVAPARFVGNISDTSRQLLANSGVVTPPAQAPEVKVTTNLSTASISNSTAVTLEETVTSGSEIVLEVIPPSNTPVGTIFRGYLELIDGTLVDLGNFTLSANQITQGAGPDGFTIVPIGDYKVYLYVGDRVDSSSFSNSSGTFNSNSTMQVQSALFMPSAVTRSPGQVEVTYDLTVSAGPNGVPSLTNPVTSTPTPEPSQTPTPTPTPKPTRSTAAPTPTPEPTTAPAPELSTEASVQAEEQAEVIDDRGLEVVDPIADAPEEVAQTTVTAVTLVAAVTAAASAATAVAAAAGAAAGAAAAGGAAGSASSGGGSSSGGSGSRTSGSTGGSTGGSSSSSSGGSGSGGSGSGGEGGDDEGATIEGVDFELEGFEAQHIAWGDGLKVWSIPVATALDAPSHNATIKISPITPLVAKLISDGAYLKAMLGTIAMSLPVLGMVLGLIGVIQSGGLLLPPAGAIVLAIAVIGVFDALAGFLAMLVFTIGITATAGISTAADVRMILGLFIIGFGPALLAGAFRGLRRPAASAHHEWWERGVDLAVAPFLGGWATKGMVEALPALSGVQLPIADYATSIAWAVAIALIVRVILEEVVAKLFPGRLNFIHPTDLPSPSNLQKVIALTMRAGIFFFVAGAFIGNSWHLYAGTVLFIAPSYLGLLQDRFPNYPKLYQLLPAGLPGLAFTLLVASGSLSVLTSIFGATPDLAKVAFVLLPIPSVILSVLGMFGREPAQGDVRWYQREKLTWLYRIGGIGMLIYTMQLTGVI